MNREPPFEMTRRAAARLDAETALRAGHHRLAIFYLCHAMGPPFDELWRYASDDLVNDEPPGAIEVNRLHLGNPRIRWPDD